MHDTTDAIAQTITPSILVDDSSELGSEHPSSLSIVSLQV